MTQPLEADMRTVTDQEWRDAHLALAETGVFPADELAYVWEPESTDA